MNLSRPLSVLALVSIALWVGGMIVLGAIVAPVVFGMVPSPVSADAMTAVFRRFDKVAVACVVTLLVTEAVQALVRRPLGRLDTARMLLSVVGGALVVWQATAISPKIEALHVAGAIRGLGEAGRQLEATHRLAELGGKLQALCAVVLIALHVMTAGDGRGTRLAG